MAFCAYCGTQVGSVSYHPCAACGSPTNGAPRPVLATGGTNAAVIAIAVVFVGLFAVAIAGILAAIAIPNFLTAIQRSKQKRTMADVRLIGMAVEAYATDTNEYPKARSIEELRPLLEPKYVPKLPAQDGWERGLRYECWPMEERCTSYAVASGGKDGSFERSSLQAYPPGTTSHFDCDIVYSGGQFVVYPEGVQSAGEPAGGQ